MRPRVTTCPLPDGADLLTIQEIFRYVALDEGRNELIVEDIARAVADGRYPLVLTQRTQQRDLLAERLTHRRLEVLTLSSQPSARVRSWIRGQLTTPPPPQGRVILATGRLVGEGFDLFRLDTLFLAAPVSWRNVLQQYIGRLHRDHAEKRDVIVYDYVDTAIPALTRMYRRRAASYRPFGYHLKELPRRMNDASSSLRHETTLVTGSPVTADGSHGTLWMVTPGTACSASYGIQELASKTGVAILLVTPW